MSITTASPLPTGVVGTSYNAALAATGGTPSPQGPPYTWALVSGTLPPGLTLNPAGSLVSNPLPTTAGTYTFTLGATDTLGQQATKPFTLTIAGPLTITTATQLPFAVQGSAYQAPGGLQLQASGGTPPYNNWSANGLPAGMAISTLGVLSGPPTLSGTYSFSVTLLDSSTPQPISATKTLLVVVDPPMSITTASPLPTGLQGQAYSGTLAVTGGTPAYTWSVTGGALPGGMTLSASGALSGPPTAAGTFNFTAAATDTIGQQVSKTFTLVIGATLSGRHYFSAGQRGGERALLPHPGGQWRHPAPLLEPQQQHAPGRNHAQRRGCAERHAHAARDLHVHRCGGRQFHRAPGRDPHFPIDRLPGAGHHHHVAAQRPHRLGLLEPGGGYRRLRNYDFLDNWPAPSRPAWR